jgi:hypothetical protein
MKDSFYIRLPSNVKVGSGFESNTLATYITKLATPQMLSKNYEVALAEISYTNSWYNINTDQEMYVVDDSEQPISDTIVYLRAGRYESQKAILDLLNRLLLNFESHNAILSVPFIEINPNSRRVSIISGKKRDGAQIYLKFGRELSALLGFDSEYFDKQMKYDTENTNSTEAIEIHNQVVQGRQNANFNYELSGGIHSLYVYSNIVEPSLVGDSYSQLLRIVSVPRKSEFGDQIVLTYESPQYFKLLTREFQTIEMSIKDDTGSDIKFRFGRSVCTLHFREKQNE